MVGIEDPLHILGHLILDIGAPVAHGIVERDLADHRTHRTIRDFLDRLIGVGELEQIEFGRADVPADRISDVEQVLISGGGIGGCAQLFDLTSDLLRLLSLDSNS